MTASAWIRAAGVDSGRDGSRQRAVSSGRVRVRCRGEQRAGEERGESRGRRGGLLSMQGEGDWSAKCGDEGVGGMATVAPLSPQGRRWFSINPPGSK